MAFPLSVSTTLDRVAALLKYLPKTESKRAGIINAEDKLTLAVALGLAMSIIYALPKRRKGWPWARRPGRFWLALRIKLRKQRSPNGADWLAVFRHI
ncbi:MAG: hypothetical protein LBJ12_02855 [Oscillospiraceae bacterium]|nr:hypothetical protein [Oscillospiraceae bacterium]